MSTMLPCLICDGSCDKATNLEAQTIVVFLLQNILGVSSSKCVKYLERFGNPCDWINLCPQKCLPLISQALELHKQIEELSQKIGIIKGQVLVGIRRPIRNQRKSQNFGLIEQELREIVNSGISDFDKTEEMVETALNFVEIDIKMEALEGSLEAFGDYEMLPEFRTEQEEETDKNDGENKFLDEDENELEGDNNSVTSDSEFNDEKEAADLDYDKKDGRRKVGATSKDASATMEKTADGKLSCSLCSKTFRIRNSLRKHQNMAHNLFFKKHLPNELKATPKPPIKVKKRRPKGKLCCDLCSKSYDKINSLRKHQNYVHKIFFKARPTKKCKLREIVIEPLDEEDLSCLICSMTFESKRAIRRHMKEIHPNNEKNVEAVPYCAEMNKAKDAQKEVSFGDFDGGGIDQDFTAEQEQLNKLEDEATFLDAGDDGGSEWEGDKNSNISGKEFNAEEDSDDSDYDEKPIKRKGGAKSPKGKSSFSKNTKDNDMGQDQDDEVESNECVECNQTFSSKISSRNHKLTIHSGSEASDIQTRKVEYLQLVKEVELTPWKCCECFRWFSNEGLRTEHQKTEHEQNLQLLDEDLQFTCDHCESRRYRSAAELSLHNEIEHNGTGLKGNEIKFSCENCECNFREASRLEFHLGAVHGILANPKKEKVGGICPICGLACLSLHYLSIHMRQHRGVRRFLCELCSSTFTANRYLEIHKTRVHGNSTEPASHPFGCVECNKIFSTHFYLKAHMATKHEKRYKYICDICGAGRGQLSAFKQHMLSHQEKRDYICKHCGASYKTSSSLSYHMGAKHSGNKHICEFCGREFSSKQDRIRHENAVHKKDPKYKCEDCSKTFPIMDYYSRHRARCHGIKMDSRKAVNF